MDKELKRGLLEYCALAAIRDGESYGYQMLKDIRPYIELSEPSLYTVLRRLEAASMVTVRLEEHNCRLRKYFRITEAGRKRLSEFENDWEQLLLIHAFITRKEKTDDEN